jgi:hypothetical protein
VLKGRRRATVATTTGARAKTLSVAAKVLWASASG